MEKLDKNKCKSKEFRTVSINVRVTPSMSKFMKENEYSPSQIMIQALKMLGYKD